MCGYCRAAERLLNSKGLSYDVIKVDEDPGIYEHMKEDLGSTHRAADFHR